MSFLKVIQSNQHEGCLKFNPLLGRCRGYRRIGDICSVVCASGFALEGPRIRRCLLNNQWSGRAPKCIRLVVKCPTIKNLDNGLVLNHCVDKYSIGCFITYKCNEGFALNGNRVIQCLSSGKWSEKKPECKVKATPPFKCPKLWAPLEGYWVSKGNSDDCDGNRGQTCTLVCIAPSVLVGPAFVVCHNDKRQWSQPIPDCLRQNVTIGRNQSE